MFQKACVLVWYCLSGANSVWTWAKFSCCWCVTVECVSPNGRLAQSDGLNRLSAMVPKYLIISRYLLFLGSMKRREFFLGDWCEVVLMLCDCHDISHVCESHCRLSVEGGGVWIRYSDSVSVGHLVAKNLCLLMSCKRILFSARKILHIHGHPVLSMEQGLKEHPAIAELIYP
jgi:hypothetical protein